MIEVVRAVGPECGGSTATEVTGLFVRAGLSGARRGAGRVRPGTIAHGLLAAPEPGDASKEGEATAPGQLAVAGRAGRPTVSRMFRGAMIRHRVASIRGIKRAEAHAFSGSPTSRINSPAKRPRRSRSSTTNTSPRRR